MKSSTQKRAQRYCLGSILLLFCFIKTHSVPSSLTKTQSQLKRLDVQISRLQQTLTRAHNKQAVFNQELSLTEKQIGEGIRELTHLQTNIHSTETKIKQLQAEDLRLHRLLKKQQDLLASHVRARYQMGESQALKSLFEQDSPLKASRVATYYQYLVQSRQKLIKAIDDTSKKMNANKAALHQELASSVLLKNKLTQRQGQLVKNKCYRTALIHSLGTEIQNQQQHLQTAKKNKDNLAAILHSLASQSVQRTHFAFGQMRKKLPYPIRTAQKSLQKMNQGVTFFADEGTSVLAVYPGKVVFSDWLRGYGLLLILDHGQGFMTLYAHNQSLFKRKGQIVRQNEPIASVGHTGGIKQNGLYFEIRIKGKAIPPLGWFS